MTIEMWTTIGILAAAILLFITEWLRVDIVALLVVVTLILTGVLNVPEAIAGFSNPAVLTIAALFIIGGAVLQTGLAGMIGRQILAIAGRKQNRLVAVIMGAVALLSSFMSDTGTVAVLLPAIISLSRSVKQAASKLLIPLSFGALLGGAMTLIGTPPNIIVSDILADQGMQPFQFFDYTLIGIILLIAGIGFMLLIGIRLLPEKHAQQMPQRIDTPSELVDIYRLPENLFKLRVRRGSPLVGKTLQETNLGQNFNVTILKIWRDPEPRELAKFGERKLMLGSDEQDEISPHPNIAINADDIFIVQGHHNDVNHASASLNLAIQPAESLEKETLISQEAGVAEVLLPPRSSLVGKTIVDARFGTLHQLTVLGINRPGGDNPTNLKHSHHCADCPNCTGSSLEAGCATACIHDDRGYLSIDGFCIASCLSDKHTSDGRGNYQFSDYIKVGVPLILLTMVISVLVLPLLWPLN